MDVFRIKCWNCNKLTIMLGPFIERKNSYLKFFCIECSSDAYVYGSHRYIDFKLKIAHVEKLFIFKLFNIKDGN